MGEKQQRPLLFGEFGALKYRLRYYHVVHTAAEKYGISWQHEASATGITASTAAKKRSEIRHCATAHVAIQLIKRPLAPPPAARLCDTILKLPCMLANEKRHIPLLLQFEVWLQRRT